MKQPSRRRNRLQTGEILDTIPDCVIEEYRDWANHEIPDLGPVIFRMLSDQRMREAWRTLQKHAHKRWVEHVGLTSKTVLRSAEDALNEFVNICLLMEGAWRWLPQSWSDRRKELTGILSLTESLQAKLYNSKHFKNTWSESDSEWQSSERKRPFLVEVQLKRLAEWTRLYLEQTRSFVTVAKLNTKSAHRTFIACELSSHMPDAFGSRLHDVVAAATNVIVNDSKIDADLTGEDVRLLVHMFNKRWKRWKQKQ